MHVCVRVSECVCVCERACVRMHECVCVCACMCVRVSVGGIMEIDIISACGMHHRAIDQFINEKLY